jgi:hypothetical protein
MRGTGERVQWKLRQTSGPRLARGLHEPPLMAEPTHRDMPCDFLAFLAERWNTDEELAADRLGRLLATYEPSRPAPKGLARTVLQRATRNAA